MKKRETGQKMTLPETKTLVVKKSTFLKNELGVITKQSFRKGQKLFDVTGQIQSQQTKYSFAMGLNKHIEPQRNDGSSDFGHYFNHSCDPNAMIHIVDKNVITPYIEVIARKNIKTGEELTFDYASLEYDVTIANSVCKCNTLECRGVIYGFKNLPNHIIKKYKKEGLISNYLIQIYQHKQKKNISKSKPHQSLELKV